MNSTMIKANNDSRKFLIAGLGPGGMNGVPGSYQNLGHGELGISTERYFIRKIIEEYQAEVVIPPRKRRTEPREYDAHLYKERHLGC